MREGAAHLAGLLAALAVFGADRASKLLVLRALEPGEVVPVLPFLNIVLVYNRGVSFGLLGGLGAAAPWLLVLLALAIAGLLLWWALREDRPMARFALWTVLGGALGNVYDRLRYGAVVDFVDLHVAGWHWPAFNLADAAVVGGVLWLLGESLAGARGGRRCA